MNEFNNIEMYSAHDVKVMLCYLLEKLKNPVTEEQLYEIVQESEIINYFYYTEAMGDLIKNESVVRVEREGKIYIEATEKGKYGAEYFNDSIPYYFRKKLLKTAMYYFARIKRENEADIEITDVPNGCEVTCKIKDTSFDMMRLTLYAPDYDQAKLIKDKIMLDPTGFYKKVIGFALENEEEQIKIDVD